MPTLRHRERRKSLKIDFLKSCCSAFWWQFRAWRRLWSNINKACEQILKKVPIVRHSPFIGQKACLKMARAFFSDPNSLEDLWKPWKNITDNWCYISESDGWRWSNKLKANTGWNLADWIQSKASEIWWARCQLQILSVQHFEVWGAFSPYYYGENIMQISRGAFIAVLL